jgi:predicted nucleic acid-binding protein
MSEPVFVDASAWVAITNRTDRVHGEALRIYHRLLRSQIPLITSTWTAYEALTIVKTKLGYPDRKAVATHAAALSCDSY